VTLEQYASVGQIVAALAVVISLIYLARQVRQNTAMMRVAAAGERVQRDTDMATSISDSQEFAELWVRAGSAFDTLSDVEKTRVIFFERRAIVHTHNMFTLRQRGLLSDSDWKELQWILKSLGGQRKSFKACWALFKDSYDEPFRRFVEERIEPTVSE
jgi:hypothetical protein